jgi:hypothetical protein
MISKNKRGQQNIVSGIFIGVVVLFILFIGVTAFINSANGAGFWNEIGPATESVSNAFMGVFGPLFNGLLGLDSAGNNSFLMVLVFILISIILVGTLDTVNMFGDDGKGKITNFLIGIIISIIGVRFMPSNLWDSLTAPSSAFVATVILGLPFSAMLVLTIKAKALVSKLLWLLFLIFSGNLVFRYSGEFTGIYISFMIAAAVMLFFDSTVRKFFHKEKAKLEAAEQEADIDLMGRKMVRDEIAAVKKIIDDVNTPAADLAKAKVKLAKLRKKYAEMTD